MKNQGLRLLPLLALLMLLGCATPVAQPPAPSTSSPTPHLPISPSPAPPFSRSPRPLVSPSPRPLVSPSPVPGWHTIYTRPGFEEQDSIDVRAVGDVMLGRHVTPVLRAHDPDWLFALTAALLQGDLVLGNLESPLTDNRRPEHLRPGPFRLAADPELVSRLSPFTMLSLANNHALDAGPGGLADTEHTLQEANIQPLGIRGGTCAAAAAATTTSNSPSGPRESSIPPRPIILAFNAVRDPQDQPTEAEACGRAWLDEQALHTIGELRQGTNAPIIVLVHWGDEYSPEPNEHQRAWAAKLVAAGVDLVLGAHPHVVQTAEVVQAGGRQGYVAFSLGNFVFDQPTQAATSHSVILRAQLDGQGVGAVSVAPVVLRNGRPEPLPLNDPAAVAQLAAIEGGNRTASAGSLQAWRWNGTTFVPFPVPAATKLPEPAQQLDVDLRGDGSTLRATLSGGLVQLRQEEREVWRNEELAWHVAGMSAGDADNDGRFEILLRLWKPDKQGIIRSHPFLLGWRGGYYRIFWGVPL